jgi:hypothetical protein
MVWGVVIYRHEGNASMSKQQRADFLHWQTELLLWIRPPADDAGKAILADAKITTVNKWHQFCRWCVWLGTNWGMYGVGIWPAQTVVAEESDGWVGITRVRAWLRAATGLGIFREVAPATAHHPAKYDVAPFWATAGEARPATEHITPKPNVRHCDEHDEDYFPDAGRGECWQCEQARLNDERRWSPPPDDGWDAEPANDWATEAA